MRLRKKIIGNKLNNMQLIYIKSALESKNHSVIRSLLNKVQGSKITPYILKLEKSQLISDYLKKEEISYEIYDKTEPNQKTSDYITKISKVERR